MANERKRCFTTILGMRCESEVEYEILCTQWMNGALGTYALGVIKDRYKFPI